MLLRLGVVECVDFLRIEEGGPELDVEVAVEVDDWVDCLCVTGGGGGTELSEVDCEALSFSLSLCPRCGKCSGILTPVGCVSKNKLQIEMGLRNAKDDVLLFRWPKRNAEVNL